MSDLRDAMCPQSSWFRFLTYLLKVAFNFEWILISQGACFDATVPRTSKLVADAEDVILLNQVRGFQSYDPAKRLQGHKTFPVFDRVSENGVHPIGRPVEVIRQYFEETDPGLRSSWRQFSS